MTLYERAMEFIKQYIEENKLSMGDKLPTEAQFSAMTTASIVTIRRAMSELEQQGILRREQGKGTFLSRRPRIEAEPTKVGSLRNSLQSYDEITTKILSISSRAQDASNCCFMLNDSCR